MKYIMSLDQGTTSSRCVLFDHAGNICAMAQKEFRQIFPQPGWVEHDAMEIWDTTLEVSRAAIGKLGITAEDIAAIGITNQRESGIKTPASLSPTPSSGSAAVPLRSSTRWCLRDTPKPFGRKPAWCRTRISPAARSNGCWTM